MPCFLSGRPLLAAGLSSALLLLMARPLDAVARAFVQPPPGVVVEEVAAGSEAAAAGIKPGDLLLSWRRAAEPPANPTEARGEIGSPFDLSEVEIEQAPRGPITFAGSRNGEGFSATLPAGEWRLSIRPQMPKTLLAGYQEGKTLIDEKNLDSGVAQWREAAAQADPMLAAWLLWKSGNQLTAARRWDEAHLSYQMSLDAAGSQELVAVRARIWESRGAAWARQPDLANAEAAFHEARRIRESVDEATLVLANTLHNLGLVAFQRGDLDEADRTVKQSTTLRQKLAPDSLTLARSLNMLGVVAMNRGNLEEAELLNRRSLEIRERRAPDSADVAQSLDNLGNVARQRGDLASAQGLLERALTIDERRSPGSLDVASSLNGLASLARDRGDFAAAEQAYRKALAIREKLAPGALLPAESLHNLGVIAAERGDLMSAEDFYRRSLAIRERIAPNGLPTADTLHNLGTLALKRRDLAMAKSSLDRALTIFQQQAPDSIDVARALNNLGTVASEEGDLEKAEALKRQAFAIREHHAPDSLDVAVSLHELGALSARRGNLVAARELTERALVIQQRLAPDSLGMAESLSTLGELAERSGDSTAAADLHSQALARFRALAPGSTAEALTLHRLGALHRAAGRLTAANDHFTGALATLETQIGTFGSRDEIKSGFAAQYSSLYRDSIGLLLDLKRPAEAFAVLERSRARSLLTMLAERDLLFSSDLGPEIPRERRLIDADYDRAQAQMARLSPTTDRAEIARLLARLRELRDRREAVAQQIRKTSPRFAALHYPRSLDLRGTQAALDTGTVLLSYSVDKEKTTLFVIQPLERLLINEPAVTVLTLPIGEATLREQVTAFWNVIQRPAAASDPATPAASLQLGQRLFDLLIKPAARLVAAADRVLISPDAALHSLPFGALVQDADGSGARPRYFVEWKPLHTVISATVYAELQKTRRKGAVPDLSLVAFGDPEYPAATRNERADDIASPEIRGVRRRGYDLQPLPASRAEVQGIASLYAKGARTYLGAEATEERAKAVGKGVSFLHFAAHGLLDEQFPLNSALALTMPERLNDGQDNGLLQAWEIFEHLRIDADLVTLSACDTALGKEMGGEGLVGLTRAFQYAGARSVLASLWSVADDSTGELMTGFYSHLKRGATKDEALRAAQLTLIRSRRLAHPFHWAAFTLTGDWR